jgi:acyl-CoA dehydrogenase
LSTAASPFDKAIAYMNFELSERTRHLVAKLEGFMRQHVYPNEKSYYDWIQDPQNLWVEWPPLESLKQAARQDGLWNLFLPPEYGEYSAGLTNLEYAPLAEIMGRVPFSAEIFNCSAPDTGNMEVLARFGSPSQQQRWLKPLLDGEIRSAYAMTEPQVASSDATNIELTIARDRDDYVLDGRKWWISGVRHPRCAFLIVMGKTDVNAPRHAQQSQVIVPIEAPGLRIVRQLRLFGSLNSPGGEAELLFEKVRIPRDNLILGEGRGFEIAQGRLGPGRIHHCMRSVGQAQRALELMARRVNDRVAFGKKLSEQSSIRQDVARSFCEVEMARLLTLKAADAMDRVGNKVSKDLIAAIKVVAPQMAQTVCDRAMQVHGGMGMGDDVPIAYFFMVNRFLRVADGPDEVHMSQLGKLKIEEYSRV